MLDYEYLVKVCYLEIKSVRSAEYLSMFQRLENNRYITGVESNVISSELFSDLAVTKKGVTWLQDSGMLPLLEDVEGYDELCSSLSKIPTSGVQGIPQHHLYSLEDMEYITINRNGNVIVGATIESEGIIALAGLS
jgi:hypothetical protein